MKLWDLIRIANRNLLRSKLRTSLTVMAIFVGAFTLTLTNGIGDGLRQYIETQVKNIEGKNILFVRKKFPREDEVNQKIGEPEEYKETTEDDAGNVIDPNSLIVSLDQMKTLAKQIPEVNSVTPAYGISAEYITIAGGKKYRVGLGTLSDGIVQKLETGHAFDGRNQVILPLALARISQKEISGLVGKTAVIAYKSGEEKSLKTVSLKIAGVATKGMMVNNNTFVDIDTAEAIYRDQQVMSPNYNLFGRFTFRLNSTDEKALASVKSVLEKKGFVAQSFADIEKRTYDAIGILKIGLNFFAFIALLAASFGIINTLIIAVMERTKDIGLQKALGMGRGLIFLLFSLESIFIGFWGALLGIAGGILMGSLANFYLARTYFESFDGYSLFVFTPQAVGFIMVLVCIIAFLAGVMPAMRASRLNPIEALRYE